MRESFPKSVAQIMPFQNRNTLLASGRDPLTRCSSWSPAHRALGQPHKFWSAQDIASSPCLKGIEGQRVSPKDWDPRESWFRLEAPCLNTLPAPAGPQYGKGLRVLEAGMKGEVSPVYITPSQGNHHKIEDNLITTDKPTAPRGCREWSYLFLLRVLG